MFVFFAVTAGDSGLFSAKGIVNFLEVSAQLGILAAPVALLMIAGEFDLSVGSMIGFAGILIAIPAVIWGWPIWLSIVLRLRRLRRSSAALNGLVVVTHRAAVLHRDAGQPVHAARPDARRHPRHHRAHPGVRPSRTLAADDWLDSLFSGHGPQTARRAGSPSSA